MDSMIPKIIHYCWFGRNPLPKSALECIKSWKKYFPEFEVKEWNEDNFDVNVSQYTKAAYNSGKYAFVSDYARYWILYHFGGVYFDTDVKVIRTFDDIIEKSPFLGIEKDRNMISVNPGLCMGVYPKMEFCKDILRIFDSMDCSSPDYEPEAIMIKETTNLLVDKGFIKANRLQSVAGFNIYPSEFFDPLDDYTGKCQITENTRSIHLYAKSWVTGYSTFRDKTAKFYHRILRIKDLLKI
ncbi:MAG: glycosyl transferase [Paramuribaculum sp.]|nr:glycosyl transferase [Paramuribaculum sp.]